MTKDELLEILYVLEWARNTDSCIDSMMEKEVENCITIVKKELDKNEV